MGAVVFEIYYLMLACFVSPSLAIWLAVSEVLNALSAISRMFLASFSSFSAKRRDSLASADMSTDCLPN